MSNVIPRLDLAFAVVMGPVSAMAEEPTPPPQWAISPAPKGLSVEHILKATTTVVGQPLAYLQTQTPEVSSGVQTYQPGGETGWHYHLTSTNIYVLEGTLTLEIADGSPNGTRKEFKAGQANMESVNTWYNARNRGDTPLKLLVVTVSSSDKWRGFSSANWRCRLWLSSRPHATYYPAERSMRAGTQALQ